LDDISKYISFKGIILKKIIVTPAGRKQYLDILSKYLIYYHSLGEFDEWHLWCNTDVFEDIKCVYDLSRHNSFIKVIPTPTAQDIANTCNCDKLWHEGSQLVYSCTIPYFIRVDSTDKDAVYLRLDDDIVFIEKDSIKKLFEFRLNNHDNFLVYGNIVNNAVLSNIHQNIGALDYALGTVRFDAFDYLGIYSGQFAQHVHANFFDKYEKGLLDLYKFEPFVLTDYSKISIQVISYFGSSYAKFDGIIPIAVHEEDYQSCIMPEIENKKNVIFGDSLFCHYASGLHRSFLDTTNVLINYKRLADNYLGE
jgi:hypothetical protein